MNACILRIKELIYEKNEKYPFIDLQKWKDFAIQFYSFIENQ